eukprot:gene14088-biopygen11705
MNGRIGMNNAFVMKQRTRVPSSLCHPQQAQNCQQRALPAHPAGKKGHMRVEMGGWVPENNWGIVDLDRAEVVVVIAGGGCAAKEGDSGGNSAPCAVMLINCFAKPHLTTGDGGGVLGGGVQ